MAQLTSGRFSRTKSVMVRLTPDEHRLIKRASRTSRSVADYIRGVLMNELTEAKLQACAKTKGFIENER